MAELIKEELIKDLGELKNNAELPALFLTNYFLELRKKVDNEIATKQMNLKEGDDIEENKKKLNEIWRDLIVEIDSFESQLNKSTFDLKENKERINSIEAMLKEDSNENLNKAKEAIESEEIDLMKILFQNKTIVFFNVIHLSLSSLIDYKLIILNYEFISFKQFKQR
jgi:hypothetical protein